DFSMRRLPLTILCAMALMVATSAAVARRPSVVTVEICEKGVPEDNSWPENPQVTESYPEDVFGLFELPQKYISTGVRANRAFPTLVRARTQVTLPAGTHRVLLRSRGQARLLVDGEV